MKHREDGAARWEIGIGARGLATALLLTVAMLIAILGTLHGGSGAVGAAILLALLVPGLGVVVATDRGTLPQPVVSALLWSIGWTTAVGLACAWLQWQSPVGQVALLALPALVGSVRTLWRPTDRRITLSWLRPESAWWWRYAVGVLLLALAVASFVTAVVRARGATIGDYGLLPALGPPFVVALLASAAMVLTGAVADDTGDAGNRAMPLLIGGLGLLGAMFTITPALLTPYFLDGWDYKHFGVVDLIARGLPLDDPTDAFQHWPGFFADSALVQSMTGVPPIGYANLAQALFLALSAYGLWVALRSLFDRRVAAVLGVLVFLSSMWAGQIYFGPQSLGFVLVTLQQAQLVLLLRSLPPPEPDGRGPRARVVRWLIRGAPGAVRLSERGRTGLTATFVVGFLATVVTHQLSPYALLLQGVPFVLLGWLRGRRMLPFLALATTPLIWLFLNRSAVAANDVLNGFSLANTHNGITWATSPQQVLASRLAHVVGATVWLAGTVAAATYARRFGRVLVAVALAFMPFALVAAGSYGGELINRLWLFTAPWFAALIGTRIADLPRTSRRLPRVRVRAVTVVVAALASVAGLVASMQATDFGMFPMLEVDTEHLAAARWLDEQTPPGSTIVTAMSSFPDRISAGYAERDPLHGVNDPSLTDYDYIADQLRDGVAPDVLAREVREQFGDRAYVVFSASMERQNEYFRMLPKGRLTALADTLRRSRAWQVAYRNDEVVVLRPAAAAGATTD